MCAEATTSIDEDGQSQGRRDVERRELGLDESSISNYITIYGGEREGRSDCPLGQVRCIIPFMSLPPRITFDFPPHIR